MTLARTYWEVFGEHRRRALAVVALWTASGVFEGLALATIVPLLGAGVTAGGLEKAGTVRYHVLGRTLQGPGLRALALGAFVVFGLLSAGARFLAESQQVRLTARIEESMRRRSTGLLLRMRWSEYLSMRLGDINTSMLAAGTHVGLGAQWFLRGVGATIIAALFGVLATLISPKLSLFTFAFAAAAAMGYRYTGRRAEAHATDLTRHANAIGVEVADIFGNLKFFRSTGNVTRSEERTGSIYRQAADAYARSQIFGPIMRVAFEAGALVFVGAMLTLSLIIDGRFSAQSIAFFALFYRLAPRILTAQEFFQLSRTQRPWYRNWAAQAATAAAAQEVRRRGRAPVFERSLQAEDVSFTFPGTAHRVLDGVSWTLERGGCLAFVGESGSGKTSMLDLVTGLLTPTSGRVVLDGTPLTEIDLETWQSRIGLVMQDTPLFHASVLENVRWTEPELDRAKAMRSIDMAYARDFVDALPDGIDTVVGEKGARLSGGERQRLALARALYRDPWLLVLDEPTSALDAESEAMVQQALEGIKGACSILLVAHRLKSVQMADRIFLLDAGRVVQEGSWNELVRSRGGGFAALAARQQLDVGPLEAAHR